MNTTRFLSRCGLAALAAAAQGFAVRRLAGWERAAFAATGLLLVFPALLEPLGGAALPAPHWIGLALGAALLALQRWHTAPA